MRKLLFLFIVLTITVSALKSQDKNDKDDALLNSSVFKALKFRSVGPAFASGRVSDIVVNPTNFSEWYVAFGSSGIWKTTNNGQTFEPIFDNYGSYSIGCLAMDPTNSNVIWAGTGENNHQRALGNGDGVYKSVDGGKSWKNMGLKNSFHIGMIAINPQNTDIVFVAAEGSAWGPGEERGLYKTTDGGKNWTKVIDISENTGINNVIIDPNNPKIMYATAEQRRRRQYGKIGGGPEAAVYKSVDGGDNWIKKMKGLPSGDLGGMGIAISPINSDYVYLIVEKEGFYRTTNRGESWDKMSDYASSGQYYNEIYCSPHDINTVYSTETVSKISVDGGKTWNSLGLKNRHVDDHALWINPNDKNHFIIGGDGGIYITYDSGANYFHVGNTATTQYYRVSVDNQKPFYWIYGGTQDNNSHAGPSQSFVGKGISNNEWLVTAGGDGFWSQADPVDPNIIYAEYQYGNLFKYFKNTGERIHIRPTPPKDEMTYKWYWDTPFLISNFDNNRLYICANKVFRSNDGGLTWKTISNDLTAQIDRHSLKIMDKYWSSDAIAKDVSTSLYGVIVAMAESPVKDGLLYVGTDDGLIQVSENANTDNPTWRKIGNFPGIPKNTMISDIFPSNFDENVVYATFNGQKLNDLKPYIMKSTNKGKSWKMITNGLPENAPVWTVAQDFKSENLLFCGTELGFFFSVDGGENWLQIKNGIPVIAVRDIAIQKDENDIAVATFGRSFYVLDDYSCLRNVSETFLKDTKAFIFDIPIAKIYMQKGALYGQGSTDYYAKNDKFGASFTYYIKEVPKTAKQIRKKKEKELFKEGKYIPQPSWRQIEEEKRQIAPYLVFTIADENGNVIRKINKPASKGINRITWDLRFASIGSVSETQKINLFKNSSSSLMVMPGKYKIKMGMIFNGEYKELTAYKDFDVEPITNTNLSDTDRKEFVEFQQEIMDFTRTFYATMNYYKMLKTKLVTLKQAAINAVNLDNETIEKIEKAQTDLFDLKYVLYGPDAKASWEEVPPQIMPISKRLQSIHQSHRHASHTITNSERENLKIIKNQFKPVYDQIKIIGEQIIPEIEKELEDAGAAYTPGVLPVWK